MARLAPLPGPAVQVGIGILLLDAPQNAEFPRKPTDRLNIDAPCDIKRRREFGRILSRSRRKEFDATKEFETKNKGVQTVDRPTKRQGKREVWPVMLL